MSVVLDVVLILFLGVVFFYMLRLNKNLRILKKEGARMEILVASFSESTIRAESLMKLTEAHVRELRPLMKEADVLRDDLSFLVSQTKNVKNASPPSLLDGVR